MKKIFRCKINSRIFPTQYIILLPGLAFSEKQLDSTLDKCRNQTLLVMYHWCTLITLQYRTSESSENFHFVTECFCYRSTRLKHSLHNKALVEFLKKEREKSNYYSFSRICLYFLDTVYPHLEHQFANFNTFFSQEFNTQHEPWVEINHWRHNKRISFFMTTIYLLLGRLFCVSFHQIHSLLGGSLFYFLQTMFLFFLLHIFSCNYLKECNGRLITKLMDTRIKSK